MRPIPRRRSLFWTLGGAFLGVLLLVLVAQALVVVLVIEPATRRAHLERAEFLLEGLTDRVEDALTDAQPQRVRGLLRRAAEPGVPWRLALRTADGRWLVGSRMGRGTERQLEALWRGDVPPPGPGRGAALEILASAPLEGGAILCVIEPRRRLRVTDVFPRQAAVYLPVAFVVAAAAGLLLSHRIQRRLAGLERLAERVGAGDLGARIERPGDDELGRVGERLNAMAASLERARDELDAVQEQRRRLFADITHDLATPLTSIRGYAETLLDDRIDLDPDDRSRYLRDVLHAAERMDRLIAELLDLARLESGAAALECEDLDLNALARHATRRFEPLFAKEGRSLVWSGDEGAVDVHADGRRLEQVLDNLLANALRHVPTGGRVEVAVDTDDEDAHLTVTDDGPGFAPEDLERVFDRFHRGDRARSSAGSGLGLAIVREIARAHGGDAAAANRPEGGARLAVTIPRHRPRA